MSNETTNEFYFEVKRVLNKILRRKNIQFSYGEISMEEYTRYEEIYDEILAEIYEEN